MHTSEPKLFVLCQRPGLIRGGVRNPGTAAYDPAHFSEAQLKELLAEPAISIVYGRQLLPEHISDFLQPVDLERRTTFRGSSIDTDAGANALTGALAQQKSLADEVQRVEEAAIGAGADPAAEVKAAAAASTDEPHIDAAADLATGRGRRGAR